MRRTLHLHSEGWRDGREQRRSSSIGTGQQKSEQEAEETKRRQPVRHYFPLIFKQNFFFFLGKFHFFLLVFFCFLCHWQCRRLRNTLTFPSPFFLPYSACLVKETKNEWKQGDIRPKIKRMKLSSFAFLPPVGSKGRA